MNSFGLSTVNIYGKQKHLWCKKVAWPRKAVTKSIGIAREGQGRAFARLSLIFAPPSRYSFF